MTGDQIDFSAFERALVSLRNALVPEPRNDRERDGAIQRFEYTFELAWKFAKRVLEISGILSSNPRTIIRDLGQQGWIESADVWMGFLEKRNQTSHNYNEDVAEKVFAAAKSFLPEAEMLLSRLKKECKK